MSLEGQTLGSYRITRKLGEGGMGVVYLGEHTLIGRQAAIKVLLPELSLNQEIVGRFFNEARATTLIRHPGLVDVLDFGYHRDGSAFIVMEFLEGESLASCLRRERTLHPAQVTLIVRQMASAVGAAHSKGIVHRDLKPDNLFLVPDSGMPGGLRVKVLDFGIAKLAGESGGGSVRTRTGSIMGTPLYMSPEQCRGAEAVDHRSDIYAMGCIVYEMLSGRPPFLGEGAGDLVIQHVTRPPPRLTELGLQVPAGLEHTVMSCLAKDVRARPQTMEQVAMAVEGAIDPAQAWPQPSASGVTLALPGTGAVTTLGGAAAQVATAGGTMAGRRGRKLPLIAVAVVALAGVGVWLALRGRGDAAGNGKTVAAAEVPTGEPSPAAGAAPAAPAPTRDVSISVATTPPGAEIYRALDGVRLGRTPTTLKLQRTEGEAVWVLRLAGFEEHRLEVALDHDDKVAVELTPVPVAAPSASPVASPSPSKPARDKGKKDRIRDGNIDPFAE